MSEPERARVVGPWCNPDQSWERTACLCQCHFGKPGDCDDKYCKSRRPQDDA